MGAIKKNIVCKSVIERVENLYSLELIGEKNV